MSTVNHHGKKKEAVYFVPKEFPIHGLWLQMDLSLPTLPKMIEASVFGILRRNKQTLSAEDWETSVYNAW